MNGLNQASLDRRLRLELSREEMATVMSFEPAELQIKVSPLELNRIRTKEVFGNTRHRRIFLALTISVTILASYMAFALNEGIATFIGAISMLILVPFLMWHLLANPVSAMGTAGSNQILAAKPIERIYKLLDGELVEFSEGSEKRYGLETLGGYGFKDGEITLIFPDALITIPAGSAGPDEIRRFFRSLEEQLSL